MPSLSPKCAYDEVKESHRKLPPYYSSLSLFAGKHAGPENCSEPIILRTSAKTLWVS